MIKWDTAYKRYYTKIGNNPKVYINGARSRHQFKPNTKYLKELDKLLKQRSTVNVKYFKCFLVKYHQIFMCLIY